MRLRACPAAGVSSMDRCGTRAAFFVFLATAAGAGLVTTDLATLDRHYRRNRSSLQPEIINRHDTRLQKFGMLVVLGRQLRIFLQLFPAILGTVKHDHRHRYDIFSRGKKWLPVLDAQSYALHEAETPVVKNSDIFAVNLPLKRK